MMDCHFCGGTLEGEGNPCEIVCSDCSMLYFQPHYDQPAEPTEPADPAVFAAVMNKIVGDLQARLSNVQSRLNWYEVKATNGLTMSPEGIMTKPLHQQGGSINRPDKR